MEAEAFGAKSDHVVKQLLHWIFDQATLKVLGFVFAEIVALKMALDNEQYLRQLQREYLDFLDDDVSELTDYSR